MLEDELDSIVEQPPKPRRKPGHPKPGERPIPPERYEELQTYWLKGWTATRLAKHFGVTPNAIHHHIKHTIGPALKESLWHGKASVLRQLEIIASRAWDEFESKADREVVETIKEVIGAKGKKVSLKTLRRKLPEHQSSWLVVILDCIREISRIGGHYAKDRHELEVKASGELRFAGRSVDDVNREMLARIVERVEERRRYEARMQGSEAERN